MSAVATTHEVEAAVTAATAGDQSAFAALAQRYRRELQVHCYRMLGSFEDSEDMTQETFLRAWRKRGTFKGRSTFRAWLYRIATNACLDALERNPRPAPAQGEFEVPWLQPYPDHLLDELEASDAEPDAAVVAKETIELAFLVAIQHLPPRPRAVLILRDVLGWPAKDTAALLDTTVPSVTSALQRARAALKQHLPERRLEWALGSDPSERERALLRRYVEATEAGDAKAFVTELLTEDARFAMPPQPETWVGAEALVQAWASGGWGTPGFGELRHLSTRFNRQPALACYNRRPGASEFIPMALDVLRIEDGRVAEIVTFDGDLFGKLGLPESLSD